jgi:hypothetical protein
MPALPFFHHTIRHRATAIKHETQGFSVCHISVILKRVLLRERSFTQAYDVLRWREHQPGLFFTFDGEALDFRGTIATYRNIPLIQTKR